MGNGSMDFLVAGCLFPEAIMPVTITNKVIQY